MNVRFIDRVSDLVGEDAGRKARDEFLNLFPKTKPTKRGFTLVLLVEQKEREGEKETYVVFFRCPHDVVIDQTVVPQECQLVLHVLEQSTDESCQVDDMSRLVLLKDGEGLL